MWTSQYEGKSLISSLHFLLETFETISINVYKTQVEFFEYVVQWHPVDNHPAITNALTRSSLYANA